MLNDEMLSRFERQIGLEKIGEAGQLKLQSSKVLCVGVGGLGAPLSLYLASCGVGHLGLADGDLISLSNLHRQILYKTENCNEDKTVIAKKNLQELNPNCQIAIYNEYLTEENALSIIRNYDIVADCSDNFATRYLISDACVALGKINVSASVQTFSGQLAIFPGKNGPCYRCLFEELDQNQPNCNQAGVLGTTPGIIGVMQANEILKLILHIGQENVHRFMSFDLENLEFKKFKINKNKKCPSCASQTDFYKLSRPKSPKNSCQDAGVSLDEFAKIYSKEQDFILIDVRTPSEFQKGHLKNAINIPLTDFEAAIKNFDKQNQIIVYCQSGPRSIQAYQQLHQLDFNAASYLKGGINAQKSNAFSVEENR